MSIRQDIRRLYRENPHIGREEIMKRLGITKPTKDFYRILNEEQVSLRGIYSDKRRNTTAHNKVPRSGPTRIIVPKMKEE